MSKKTSRTIALIMFIIGIIFVVIIVKNPNLPIPLSYNTSLIISNAYIITMIVLLIAPFRTKKKGR